ncbi:bromodomain-containing protein DDB_G0271118-like isoform X6 [Ceratitis capitata]|uniref:bromodomain-containing protein DDB_G0271118-like isoform X6 n=1 Tax=Ceratitis capitata TaxID=7213 RepID=UPI000C6C44F6|nr:bromodomain-containing protein DDB_G0271118-like isoform X6 [Ceratitis capitata]
MAPMPRMKGTKPNGDFLYVEAESPGDSSPTPSTPPSSTDAAKSQCSSLSDGESYEGYGENEVRGLHHHHLGHHHQRTASSVSAGLLGTDVANNNNHNNSNNNGSPVASGSGGGVGGVELELAPHNNAASTPSNSGRRQLGSNALARSSSFNSSGRSSNCDTTEDMYSDISLDNVQDLNYKVNKQTKNNTFPYP